MNASASSIPRIAGIALVLILAAILGLLAGNALNARNAGGTGAAMPHMGGFDGARYSALQADDTVTRAFDSLQTWGNVDERQDAFAEREQGSATAPTPR